MKKLVSLVLALCLLAGLSASAFAEEPTLLRIGVTPAPHREIIDLIIDDMAALGYTIEPVEFTEFPLPNPALNDGQLEANYFQHIPYMTVYNATVAEDQQLAAAIAVHYEPMGIYAGKTASLEALAEGATISVTNDPSNETRSLFLLQEAGLIKLPEGATPNDSLTAVDIVENPKNFNIIEMDADKQPSTLQDVDVAVINGNFALDAGLNPNDAIFTEAPDSEAGVVYTNYVVVRAADADAQWVKDLQSVLCSKKVYDYITETYQGGVVPAFTVEEPAA